MWSLKTYGVPVAGANAGSSVSMSIERYTGFVVPTRSLIFLMIPCGLVSVHYTMYDFLLSLKLVYLSANSINLSSFNYLKAAISIILVITWARERGTDTRVDIGVVCE